MKKLIYLLFISILYSGYAYSQGAAIVKIDSLTNSFEAFLLKKSNTSITINNQIATTTTAQLFINTTADTTGFKYAYPMAETAAATTIRWFYNGQWQTASMISSPQDSTFVGDTGTITVFIPADLDTFLGKTPLYFPVNTMVPPGDSITIELTYVELLPYQNNYVSVNYLGNYNRIQPSIDSVIFNVSVASYRMIDSILPITYTGWNTSLNGTSAYASLSLQNTSFSNNLQLDYLLHPDTTGFFSFSTFYPDSIEKCDTINGFFTFIVEPNSADASEIIDKDFVLIIDHSGSMGGIKMTQANQAAEFIVNNLNSGDRFNIVQFDDIAESFSPTLLPYTVWNKNNALAYINTIAASGSTNISGAFDSAVPMFSSSPPDRAKIIVFFTDGEPTAGIVDQAQLVSHVTSLITNTAPDISLYVFGIGTSVNNQLLTEMAAQNNGTCAFLGTNNVADEISSFYTTIQNPVLLNTTIAFSPSIVSQVYPNPLPNLYKGQQLIISGRYNTPGPVQVTLSGIAFGNPVSYQYNLNLTDTTVEEYNFLPKIWTKSKIDYLVTQFYLNQNNQIIADSIQNEITNLSLCRGVISPFTSFDDNGGGFTTGVEEIATTDGFQFLKIYPNPANNIAYIIVPKTKAGLNNALVSIFSVDGKLIAQFNKQVGADGKIELDIQQLNLGLGMYIITVDVADAKYRGKLSVF